MGSIYKSLIAKDITDLPKSDTSEENFISRRKKIRESNKERKKQLEEMYKKLPLHIDMYNKPDIIIDQTGKIVDMDKDVFIEQLKPKADVVLPGKISKKQLSGLTITTGDNEVIRVNIKVADKEKTKVATELEISKELNKCLFENALKDNNITLFNILPKSDLHIHSTRGCSREIIEKTHNCNLPEVPRFKSLDEMDNWYDKELGKYINGARGLAIRMQGLAEEIKKHNIAVAAPILGLNMAKYFNGINYYFAFLSNLFEIECPDSTILPEFEVCRGDDPEKILKDLEAVEKYNFYKSIDLRGDENLGTKDYIEVYDKAREMGLVLKAHVGEFTDASKIDEALDNLKLDCINHGLSLKDSKELMKYVRDKGIMVNCCPSSNYHLSRINGYENHPIKDFVRNGITCSINTDDQLIFNSNINEEYFKLYNSGCLTVEELYEVNQNGLNKSLNKRR